MGETDHQSSSSLMEIKRKTPLHFGHEMISKKPLETPTTQLMPQTSVLKMILRALLPRAMTGATSSIELNASVIGI